MSASKSKDQLEREYYEAALAGGAGDAVRVTNTADAPVPVSGTINVGNFPAPDESGLTDAELRATPVPVSLRAGADIIGFTSPSVSKKVGEGKFFIAGKAITLGGLASTERATFQFINPAGNTKVAYIVAVVLYSTIAQQIQYFKNSTFSGTQMVPENINFASAATSTMQGQYGAGAISGGLQLLNESRVFSTSPLPLQFPPLVLPPGMSLAMRGTLGDAQTFTANVYYYEE